MKLSRFIIVFLLALFIGAGLARAQTTQDKIVERAKLQADLADEEAQIAEQTKLLKAKQKDTATVAGELALLKSQIAQMQTNIKAKQVAIAGLTDEIAKRQNNIVVLDGRIGQEQTALAELLRQTREMDRASLVEIALGSQHFSDLFHNVDDFTTIQKAIQQSFLNLRGAQDQAAIEKAALQDQQDQELDAKKAIELNQARISHDEAGKKQLLALNKDLEKSYQAIIGERQKRAAQIRAALFALAGGTAAIPFGQALDYATVAQKSTGVRPAFLLAILTQESNLGANVGSCLLSSLETGDGVGKNTGTAFEKVMKAPRDTMPFQTITNRLGRDWQITPVSCPTGARYYAGRGFGGAMGPSQFSPSTWELFKGRIGAMLGVAADQADPWNPQHAFTASAIYVSDLGASAQSYSSEIRAACKYYGSGGSTCTYGKQVMSKAQDIQLNMIDPLQNG